MHAPSTLATGRGGSPPTDTLALALSPGIDVACPLTLSLVEDFEAFGKRFRMDVHGAQGEQVVERTVSAWCRGREVG